MQASALHCISAGSYQQQQQAHTYDNTSNNTSNNIRAAADNVTDTIAIVWRLLSEFVAAAASAVDAPDPTDKNIYKHIQNNNSRGDNVVVVDVVA